MKAPRWLWIASLLPLLALVTSRGSAEGPFNEQGKLVDFQKHIAPIFVERCLECHGPKEAKNDFRIDDRDTVLGYLSPAKLEDSSLWTDSLVTHDDEMLMPPTSKGGPLSAAELALIKIWIEEGADWPEGATVVAAGVAAPVETTKPKEELSFVGRLWAFQGYFHPAAVHFPVALLCVGALFVVGGWVRPALRNDVAYYCLLLGAVSAVFASAMGWSFAFEQGYGGWTRTDNGNLMRHRWFGVGTSALSVIIAIMAIKARKSPGSTLDKSWKIGLIATAMLVSIVGHQGGELTYEGLYENAFQRLTGATKTDAAASTKPAVTMAPVTEPKVTEPKATDSSEQAPAAADAAK